jgi:hypothetical protein
MWGKSLKYHQGKQPYHKKFCFKIMFYIKIYNDMQLNVSIILNSS